ncbi:hypothetical protein HHKILHMN_00041 [Vibrio phage vB_VpaS_PGA]|nr:hypothetical protein HHKILHMN_00041 [Vibrio phage vB_VpaS_PGA]
MPSPLENAINSINNAADRADVTTEFFDSVTTGSQTETVTNPNNNKSVPTVQKQIKDLFTESETEINNAVASASQSAQSASDDAYQVALDKLSVEQSETNAAQSAANAEQSYQDTLAVVPNLQSQIDQRVTYPELTDAQEELLPPGSQIYPDDGSYLENGMNVTAGTTHIRVLIGGEPTILVAWDTLTLPATVTSIPVSDNGFAGYDVVTDQGTFEFVTTDIFNYRKNNNPLGYGYDGTDQTTANFQKYLDENPGSVVGNFILGGGIDTDLIIQPNTNINSMSINGIELSSKFKAGKRLRLPPNFPFQYQIPCIADSYGRVRLLGWDTSIFDFTSNGDATPFTTLYVDNLNGNNANDGLDPLLPLRSVNAAFDEITNNLYTRALILIAGGYYYDLDSWGSREPNTDIVVKQWFIDGDLRNNTKPTLAAETPNLSWSLNSGNVYQATRSGVKYVVDENSTNEYGDWFDYSVVSSIAECEATEGSFYTDNITVYVHRVGGGAPDSTIHCMLSKSNAGCSDGTYTLYVEGINLYGGTTGFKADSRPDGTSETVVLKDVKQLYSSSNGIENYGIDFMITQDCVVGYSLSDNYNYHSNRDTLTQVCRSIEINNIGYRAGRLDSPSLDSNNGSTSHESNQVIRLGCSYEDAQGQVVADVQDAKSYNFCISASRSVRIGETARKSSYLISGGDMWLDNCIGFDSLYSLDAYSGGNMYVEDICIDSSIEGIENISPIIR